MASWPHTKDAIAEQTVRFIWLVGIFTELVPKILLDVLTHHITLSKAFQERFGKKPWDGGQKHREWLATMMVKNPRVQDFSCAAVRKKPTSEWDTTILDAALLAVMEPSGDPCDVEVSQWCSKKTKKPVDYFEVDVSALERSDCKSWMGFSINVTGFSPPEIVECFVTEAPSDTKVVAVSRKVAKDRYLSRKIRKYMPTEVRPVHLPLPEVQDIVKVIRSRNALYHRPRTDVSGDEFTQCVASVRRLIEQALRPYFPKERSEGYLAELNKAACISETPSSPSPPIGPVPTSAQPKEVGASSTEWQSAYEDSIRKHGSVSVEVTQSIFVGPSASGKSTVKHLLVHNEPKVVKTSTAALETPEVVTKRSAMDFSSEQYAVQEGTSAWQPVSSNIMKNSLHHCIASKAYEEKNQYPIEVEAKEAEDVQRKALLMKQAQSDPTAILGQYPIEEGQNEAIAEERDGCPLPKQAQSDIASLDQRYSQVREEMGGDGMRIKLKNASFVHLLDTGGQPSFQDVLPLLLDVPCTYIQVFNASLSLSERIPVTYRLNDHTEVSLGDAECGRDMMLRSFSSMHTMAQKYSKELATFQQKDSPPPQLRIFVVGTHKDELIAQGRLDEATREIKTFLETLKGKPYYNSIQWDSRGQKFYLVNARSVNERAYVNDLRERISSEGFLKLDVPLMWFICQEVTHCTPKKFFRLQDLEAFCQKHHFVDGENAASQFRALLQLFTLFGFYAFFDLEDVPNEANFVCTDRGVFLREVSTLLAVQFSVPKGPEMESFKETGILVFSQKCLKQLGICQEMDAKWFLKALQHLGIAAHLPSKARLNRYFIPAALPQSSGDQKPTASVAPLCLTYTTEEDAGSSQNSYMPRGVFCRLAVELIRQGWKIIAKESTRTLLLFRWREFEIFLKENSGYISLIPQVVEEISTLPELHTQCECLLDTVRDGLSLSAKAVLGSNFGSVAELAVGFECPCKEVGMDHLAVPSQTRKSLDCLGTCKSQPYSNEQRIWFSSLAGVHEVELVKDTELRIWVIGERPPEPHPKPQPPQPSPSPPVPREGDALCQEVTADNFLLNFWERFIQCVDANAIVYGLENANIISDGDLTEIKRNPDPKQQNEMLHRCLKRSCDEEALMEVCDMMIAVRGNRKMNSLGRDMKCKLEGN